MNDILLFNKETGTVIDFPREKYSLFTGLKDKMGNRIYEGDIIRAEYSPSNLDVSGEIILKDGHAFIKDAAIVFGHHKLTILKKA